MPSSTSSGLPGSSPTVSSPMSSVCGARPIATSSSSPSTRSPVLELDRDAAPSRATAVAFVAGVHVDAVLAQGVRRPARRRTAPRARSGAGRPRPGRRALRATTRPAPARPRRRRRPGRAGGPGTCFAVVASRLVQGSDSRRPGIGGMRGAGAGGDDDRALGRAGSSSPTRTRRSPSMPAALAKQLDAALLEPGHLTRVVEVVDHLVTPAQDRLGVDVAGNRLAHARARGRTSANSSPGRSSALEGMQA